MSTKSAKVKYEQIFINNQFVDAVSGKTFPVINPTTGSVIANVAEADKADVDKAVAAAKAAFARGSVWRSMDASARGKLINKLADLILRDTEELATLETLNTGKLYGSSIWDVKSVVDLLRYYAGYCDKIHGNTIPSDGKFLTFTRKEPIGVVAQIIPWNYPFFILAWKWGPALAAGCTMVLKPAEQTPLTALAVAALTIEAGFPEGVINVLPGYGPTAGASLCLHNDVRKVSFTGSTEIGPLILQYAAKSNMKSVGLELGGKSPLIIFDDANVDEAVVIAHNAAFANYGQNCCAGSKTFVHADIYEEFVKKSREMAKARKIGDPFQFNIQQGPLIDKLSLDKVLHYIGVGIKEKAKLETGGKRIGTKGFFVEPTVFSDVTDDMTIAKEEIFGPVQAILKFQTLEEVIERANNTLYGLAAGIVTKNLNTALVFSQAIEAGSVWVNCYHAISPQTPFGGYKRSGIGRELGAESMEEYVQTKTVAIKLPTKC